MAIRTISYSVKSDGISPNTEQQAGLQSEHAVTQLVFTLDSTLYQALLSEKGETDTLVYRFDCCDSMGGAVKTEPSALTSDTVSFTVGENLTRSGGKARVYLVISRYNAEEKTETELLSFPAKLRFENVPETDSDNGNSRESLSTLTEAAKNAATRAEQSADTAVEAQGKTETARLAIEGGSTVVFDGNGTFGKMDVDFVVDTVLSKASDNAIANKAVAAKFEETDNSISANSANIISIQQAINVMWSTIYPIGSIYISAADTSPSTLFGGTWEQLYNEAAYVIEEGTSDIWNYRKWSDGTAECWGKWSETGIAIMTASRGVYFSDSMTKTLPFIFKGSDAINVGHVSGGMWLGNTWVSSDSNTLNYSISRATSATSESCDIRIFIIGKWSTEVDNTPKYVWKRTA